jgi:hypothetical protein
MSCVHDDYKLQLISAASRKRPKPRSEDRPPSATTRWWVTCDLRNATRWVENQDVLNFRHETLPKGNTCIRTKQGIFLQSIYE